MKILAIEKELDNKAHEDIQEVYKKEALAVYNLYKDGVIREIYFNHEKCAVIMLECDTIEEVKLTLDNLPLVQSGLIEFEFHVLAPYTGYDRLIK